MKTNLGKCVKKWGNCLTGIQKTDSNKKKFGFSRLDLGGVVINKYILIVKPGKSFGFVGGKEYF